MTIGRIGGPMLKENLVRQGVDLSFETNLLYLDVNNYRIGVNTSNPNVALDIIGSTRFNDSLQISGATISTYKSNTDISLSLHGTGKVRVSTLSENRLVYVGASGSLIDNANLTFNGSNLTVSGTANIAGQFITDNIQLDGNTISSVNTNGNIIFDPNGTGNVIVDTATANSVFFSGTNKELLTSANLSFDGVNTLTIQGTIDSDQINVGNLSLANNSLESLTGDITLNSSANIIVNSSVISAGAILYTGLNSEILADNNLLFNGTTLTVGNLTLSDDTIGTLSNSNIVLEPNGTGQVKINATNALTLPVGDTSERSVGTIGDFRYNSETTDLEYYDGTNWISVAIETDINLTEYFMGDGSTTIYNLAQMTTSGGAIVTLNGLMQSPGVSYSVSGTVLTFTEAPAIGDRIDVRYITLANNLVIDEIRNGNVSVKTNATNQQINLAVGGSTVLTVTNTALLPSTGDVYDLGSPSLRFKDLYLTGSTIQLGNILLRDTGTLTVFESDGVTPINHAGSTSISLSNDNSTDSNNFYLTFTNNQNSGKLDSLTVSSDKLYYNPLTGTLNATTFNNLSDINKKEDIELITNALDIIEKINGVKFRWRDSKLMSAGVIAQELKTVMPELVDDNWSVNYSGIIALLIEAIKQLKKEINALNSK